MYVQTLERKIAELEIRLRRAEGSLNNNHPPETPGIGSITTESSLSRTIRDLSLNASGSTYLGATSSIALARLLEPALHAKNGFGGSHDAGRRNDDPENIPSVGQESQTSTNEDVPDISAFSGPTVDRLFKAYMEYVSLPFPIVHSRKLRDMHARRAKPNGLFEVCILHLIYAIGGAHLALVQKASARCLFRAMLTLHSSVVTRGISTRTSTMKPPWPIEPKSFAALTEDQ